MHLWYPTQTLDQQSLVYFKDIGTVAIDLF